MVSRILVALLAPGVAGAGWDVLTGDATGMSACGGFLKENASILAYH